MSIVSSSKDALRGLGSEPVVILCASSAFLIISHYQGAGGFLRQLVGSKLDSHPWNSTFGHLWWFAASFVLYLVMPLILALATRGSFYRKYGMGLGDYKAGLKISFFFLVIMLPATYWASTLGSFQGIYPLGGNSSYQEVIDGKPQNSLTLFAVYELGYLIYFIAWEFMFRGWMLNGILKHWGREAAIAVQMAPFAVMHLGKAELEALGSIVAGLALGILALRTRSFWYGAFIHASVAIFMDLISVHKILFK